MTESCIVAELRFDAETDTAVRQRLHAVHQFLGKDDPEAFHPHVSLIPSKSCDEANCLQQIHEVIAEAPPIEVSFSHWGWFPSGVAFLGVTPTQRLLDLHGVVHTILAPSSETPWIDLYCPGAWVPHCTMATGLSVSDGMRAIGYLSASFDVPLRGTCVSVNLIQLAGSSVRQVGSVRFQEA